MFQNSYLIEALRCAGVPSGTVRVGRDPAIREIVIRDLGEDRDARIVSALPHIEATGADVIGFGHIDAAPGERSIATIMVSVIH